MMKMGERGGGGGRDWRRFQAFADEKIFWGVGDGERKNLVQMSNVEKKGATKMGRKRRRRRRRRKRRRRRRRRRRRSNLIPCFFILGGSGFTY